MVFGRRLQHDLEGRSGLNELSPIDQEILENWSMVRRNQLSARWSANASTPWWPVPLTAVALYLNRRLWPLTALNSWTGSLSTGFNSGLHKGCCDKFAKSPSRPPRNDNVLYHSLKTSSAEHDPRKALAYSAQVEALIGQSSFVQPQLFEWWCDESLVNADWSL
jgi:hypothetical protein